MKHAIRISLLALLFVLAFSFIVAKGGTATHSRFVASPDTAEVKIDNFSFGPQTISVAPGTKVIWKNRDDIPHTVVSLEGIFKSRVLDTDETFSFTFDKPGSYPYFCSIHPKMTGRVVVK